MNNSKGRTSFANISLWITAILGVISIIYAILDAMDVIKNIEWLQGKALDLVLLLLANVVIFLVSSYLSSIKTVEEEMFNLVEKYLPDSVNRVEELINHIQEFQAIVFKDIIDLERYQIREMKKCKTQILDLSWSNRISARHDSKRDKEVDKEYEDLIDEVSNRITYKEVFIFNAKGRREKLARRIKANTSAYSCGYYSDSQMPLLQFMVLDSHIVIFASSRYRKNIAIENEQIADLFIAYYDDIWEHSKKIKEGATIHQDALNSVSCTNYEIDKTG